MSRILVIPDIHHKVDLADAIIKKEEGNYDKIIFGGDSFDNFDDTQMHTVKTAKWLKNSLTFENRIHLIGNHDLAYFSPSFFCSGFTGQKLSAVKSVMNISDWRKMKFFCFEDGVAYSHAGVNECVMNPMDDTYSVEYIEKQCQKAFNDAEIGKFNHILGAGISRGGNQHIGGIIWGHWLADTFAIKDFPQICFHTPQRKPHQVYLPNKKNAVSWALNLDTHLHHYAIVTDGIPKIHKVSDKMYEKYDWRLIDGRNPITNKAWHFN